jgi:hypothetical protein
LSRSTARPADSVIIAGGDLRSIPLIPGEEFWALLVKARCITNTMVVDVWERQ